MLLVGLTGGIGAGKSTVAALLAERGAVILDADQVAREVVEPGQPAFAALVERFGRGDQHDVAVVAATHLDCQRGLATADATDQQREVAHVSTRCPSWQ